LSYANEDWKCVISLRFITDAKGQPLSQIRNDRFGPTIYNKAEVEERIRRAQRAILNPFTEPRHFLQGNDEDPNERQLTFSNNYVSLQISGRDVGMLAIVSQPLRNSTHCLEKRIYHLSVCWPSSHHPCRISLTVIYRSSWTDCQRRQWQKC